MTSAHALVVDTLLHAMQVWVVCCFPHACPVGDIMVSVVSRCKSVSCRRCWLQGQYGEPREVDETKTAAARELDAKAAAALAAELAAADEVAARTGEGECYGQLVVLGHKEYRVEVRHNRQTPTTPNALDHIDARSVHQSNAYVNIYNISTLAMCIKPCVECGPKNTTSSSCNIDACGALHQPARHQKNASRFIR